MTEENARTQVVEWMNQLAFVAVGGRTAADDKYLAQLEQLQDAARFVHFADDLGGDGVLLSMLMIPHQPLMIEAHAQGEETWYLISHCAAALDYGVFEPASVEAEAGTDANTPSAYPAAP